MGSDDNAGGTRRTIAIETDSVRIEKIEIERKGLETKVSILGSFRIDETFHSREKAQSLAKQFMLDMK